MINFAVTVGLRLKCNIIVSLHSQRNIGIKKIHNKYKFYHSRVLPFFRALLKASAPLVEILLVLPFSFALYIHAAQS